MPLRLHYDSWEPNSVSNWLELWSSSRFWRPIPQPKKMPDSKSHRKHGNGQTLEAQIGRPKRSTWRLPAANVDGASVPATSEPEKPKRNLKKVSNHSADQAQENPKIELEKVKRNLRKVHNPVVENSVQLEVEPEKPKQSMEKALTNSSPDILERGMNNSGEKMKKEATLTTYKLPDVETPPEPLAMKEVSDLPHGDQATVESKPLTECSSKDGKIPVDEAAAESNILIESGVKDESISITNGELSPKEDLTSNENLKSSRKASFAAKQERTENGLQSSPTLPSYMAATQSAKAKLRVQGSPRFGQDGVEKNNVTRRHSLPSLTNGKISSQSPRTQRLVQAGGKGGNKSDRSLLSSRDGNGMICLLHNRVSDSYYLRVV